jgi:hypothetical protein
MLKSEHVVACRSGAGDSSGNARLCRQYDGHWCHLPAPVSCLVSLIDVDLPAPNSTPNSLVGFAFYSGDNFEHEIWERGGARRSGPSRTHHQPTAHLPSYVS